MRRTDQPTTDATGLRIGIASSGYHGDVVGPMEEAARETFLAAGGHGEDLLVVPSPGAFELVATSTALAARSDIDAVVALGCVIRGETSHDQWINAAVSNGLAMISTRTGKPVAFGVITCDSLEQAMARAGGARGNKGEEAMSAAISAARIIAGIEADSGAVNR